MLVSSPIPLECINSILIVIYSCYLVKLFSDTIQRMSAITDLMILISMNTLCRTEPSQSGSINTLLNKQ